MGKKEVKRETRELDAITSIKAKLFDLLQVRSDVQKQINDLGALLEKLHAQKNQIPKPATVIQPVNTKS